MAINPKAKIKETPVFAVIPSPKNKYVSIANETIPVAKPINLLGHNIPSKYSTTNLVA